MRFAAVIDNGFDIQVQVESFDEALKHELARGKLVPSPGSCSFFNTNIARVW